MPTKLVPGHSIANWLPGQRVSRTDSEELGTVVEADGKIKVKWDNGRTSYYERSTPSNVKRIEPKP